MEIVHSEPGLVGEEEWRMEKTVEFEMSFDYVSATINGIPSPYWTI